MVKLSGEDEPTYENKIEQNIQAMLNCVNKPRPPHR